MGNFVKPQVHLVGFTEVHEPGLHGYLKATNQLGFWDTYLAARNDGLTGGEALCSVYAKLCYKSLVLGTNANVVKVRDIETNLRSCHETGHGSVFEHCSLNFIVTNCSRVYTHEQVRHRAAPPHGNADALDNDQSGDGVAYAQTSGRYCRLDNIDLVWSDVLDPVKDLWRNKLGHIEDLVYLTECRLGLRKPPNNGLTYPDKSIADDLCLDYSREDPQHAQYRWVPDDSFNFEKRKIITSAIRRIAPNGQSNEIGMTLNIRALRHVVQVRTARFAETEIRDIYNQVYGIVNEKFRTIFHGARTRDHEGLLEVYGMRQQPYDLDPHDPRCLEVWTTSELQREIDARATLQA
jgi:thymidylate synthase (FAD)